VPGLNCQVCPRPFTGRIFAVSSLSGGLSQGGAATPERAIGMRGVGARSRGVDRSGGGDSLDQAGFLRGGLGRSHRTSVRGGRVILCKGGAEWRGDGMSSDPAHRPHPWASIRPSGAGTSSRDAFPGLRLGLLRRCRLRMPRGLRVCSRRPSRGATPRWPAFPALRPPQRTSRWATIARSLRERNCLPAVQKALGQPVVRVQIAESIPPGLKPALIQLALGGG
jgi:hypothetical protein